MLFDSLHNKLLSLPDSSLVYPAHGAGSLCGKAISKETVSTIGEQRRVNYALQPMSKQAFVDLVTADQPDAPPYFTYDAVLNSQERPTLDQALVDELKPLPLSRVLELQRAGAQILDTREASEFAAAHLAGSLNIGLNGQYATWVGTVLDREHPIVIIADPGREQESAIRLGRIGFDHVVGYLQDGLRALNERAELTSTTVRVSAPLAAEILASEHPPLALDVRSPRERAEKTIGGSRAMPLNHLAENLSKLPTDRPLLVFLRRRLPIIPRREPAGTKWLQGSQRDCRRARRWEAARLPLSVEADSAVLERRQCVLLYPAREVGRVVDAAGAFIFRYLRVGAERPAPVHGPSGHMRSHKLVGRLSLFHPLFQRGDSIEEVDLPLRRSAPFRAP